MNVDELTIRQGKELAALFCSGKTPSDGILYLGGIDDFAHKKIAIVRTYSAGVWAGELVEKRKDEGRFFYEH